MLIDCTTCVARDIACDDCVITVLLGSPPPVRRPEVSDGSVTIELDDAARYALGNLADAGLVPPLRLVPSWSGPGGSAGPGGDSAGMSGTGREIA